MLKKSNIFAVLGFVMLNNFVVCAQVTPFPQQINNFVSDAAFYAEKFISPSIDAAVYQSSSAWMNSPKKNDFGTFTLGIHGNHFFVPKQDRSFKVSQSDFSFFTLPGNQDFVEVPTALGGEVDLSFTGEIGGVPLSISAPDGVKQEQVTYPYLQGSFALWKGFEVVAKYSTKVNLKKGNFQVYGFGLKHNFSQYFNYLDKSNINLAVMLSNSVEKINFDFIDNYVQTFGDFGVSEITGNVNTWQFQLSASKEWNNFELIVSSITNSSKAKYFLSGENSPISQILQIQSLLNDKLEEQYKTKINSIGELSGRYKINNIYIQSTFAFGKFANLNLGVQYQF